MRTEHINHRLDIRDLPYTVQELTLLAQKYAEDVAVIIGKRKAVEGIGYERIILIVRNSRPVTIMTRRESQNFDKRNFNVSKVVYQ
jgi:hypothetical protein